MSITNTLKLPTDEELTVPQEITLSTPWFKAVAPYMARSCEAEIKEFMLRRKELEDPRLTLKEGAAVTACGITFLQTLKKSCLPEVEKFADCIDKGSAKLFTSKCREEQRFVDRCVEDELKISRPKLGYFSKLHVHESVHPKPEVTLRDYKKEAAEVLKSLPEDAHLRKDYKRFQDYRSSIIEN
uniref:COX assembly mitochondrial protein n=1 Tax=Rhabditophanes sp. KR3021 TaxID=114890 RepID=A0AC35TIL4_9BILA